MNSPQNQFQISTGSIQFKAALFNTKGKKSPAGYWAGLFAKERENLEPTRLGEETTFHSAQRPMILCYD